jgi:glycerol-3-phosphate dehydrogenase (NAD(P)+)
MKVVVVGDGGWGTAMTIHLARIGADVGLWSHDPAYARHLAEHRTNPLFLPGHPIPPGVAVDSDLAALLPRADVLVSAVPTEFLRAVWTRHAPLLREGLPIVSLTKGVERETLLRPSEVLVEACPGHPVAVMSGPNIASEVAKGFPAATVVAGADRALTESIRERFSGGTFRVYTNPDAIGVELSGALKNVIAVAAGICDGMSLGHNAKAALVTRGVIEMARLGAAMGGERRTFFGLAGLGDLILTCYAPTSRNRTFGERVGRGERPHDVLVSMAQIAEGVKSCVPVRALGRKHGLPLPICDEVYLMLHEEKDPRESVESLMQRARRDEAEDLL